MDVEDRHKYFSCILTFEFLYHFNLTRQEMYWGVKIN